MAKFESNGAGPSPWEYTPLENSSEQIRLLTLMPGKGDEVINCEQVTILLDDTLAYEALSYAWGSPETTHSILFHGNHFPVTTNLHTALQHLRQPETPRCLWIDALCIDQLNDAEKSAQVQLMGDVYRRASQVLAWLGEAKDDSDFALDFLNDRDFTPDRFTYSSETLPPPVRSTEHYIKNPNKACKIIIDGDSHATLVNEEDSDDGPRLRISIPDMSMGSLRGQGPLDRLYSDAMKRVKRVFAQDDTVLLSAEESCQQCKIHGSPCWWNGKDQCVLCLANCGVVTGSCSLVRPDSQRSDSVDVGQRTPPIPDFYAYLTDFSTAPTSSAGSSEQSTLPRWTDRVWLALYHLASRPWWQRTWILQETAVNESDPVILCGSKSTTWKAIEDFTSRTMAEAILPTPAGTRWMHFLRHTETYVDTRESMKESRTLSLSRLLEISERLQASDPRDKIFALLNLADSSDRLRCKADYSLSVAEVYARTALHIIRTTKKLHILGSNTAVTKTLPSWVPDWSLEGGSSSLSVGNIYSASRNYAAQTLHPPSLTLTVRGFRVSRITHVSDPISSHWVWPSFLFSAFAFMLDSLEQVIFAAMDACNRLEDREPSKPISQRMWRFFRLFPDPRISDTFWRTLVCDACRSRSGTELLSPAPADWGEMFELLRDSAYADSDDQSHYQERRKVAQTFSGMAPEVPHLTTPTPLQVPEDFQPGRSLSKRIAAFAEPLLTQMVMSLQQRRFFIMETGHMGLTAGEVREGDMVHILLGGDVPYILRKKEESVANNDKFQLVGEAYVHEFMHGESLGTASHEVVASRTTNFDIE